MSSVDLIGSEGQGPADPSLPPFIHYDGNGTMKRLEHSYGKIDIDFGPIHIHHIGANIKYRIEGYDFQMVTMYVRIPYHPGPGPYPLLSYAGPIVMFNGFVPAISTFDQMEDIDGWPYFRLSILMSMWSEYKGVSWADVSISYEYPYQQSMGTGSDPAPPPFTSIVPVKMIHPVTSYDTISSRMSSTILQTMRPTTDPTIDMIEKASTMTYVESSIQEFTSESPEVMGKITSINTEYGHAYTIDLQIVLLISVDSKPEPIRVSRHLSWMRSTSVIEEFNAYATMDTDPLAQIPSNFFPEANIVIEPLGVEYTRMQSIFRYRIIPLEDVVISRIKMMASIKVIQS